VLLLFLLLLMLIALAAVTVAILRLIVHVCCLYSCNCYNFDSIVSSKLLLWSVASIWFEIWKVVGPGLKTWVVGLKRSTGGGTQHRIDGIITEIFIYYTQIYLFLKSTFWKVFSSHSPVHYRI